MIALLTILTAVTIRMLHMDWGAIAPSSDTLYKRNKELVIAGAQWTTRFIGGTRLKIMSIAFRPGPQKQTGIYISYNFLEGFVNHLVFMVRQGAQAPLLKDYLARRPKIFQNNLRWIHCVLAYYIPSPLSHSAVN